MQRWCRGRFTPSSHAWRSSRRMSSAWRSSRPTGPPRRCAASRTARSSAPRPLGWRGSEAVTGARRIAVVGGGIAGVAAAERLPGPRAAREAFGGGGLGSGGHAVELFEEGERLGGRIAPERLGEREVALGGKNVGRKYTELRA